MKQSFIITSKKGIGVFELLGMLEEGNSQELWEVEEAREVI